MNWIKIRTAQKANDRAAENFRLIWFWKISIELTIPNFEYMKFQNTFKIIHEMFGTNKYGLCSLRIEAIH